MATLYEHGGEDVNPVIVPERSVFHGKDRQLYVLQRELRIPVVVHNGVFAGVYVENPVEAGAFIRQAPRLEEGDVRDAVDSVITSLCVRLQSINPTTLKAGTSDRKFYDSLKDLFFAA